MGLFNRRVPLAWHNLTHSFPRLAIKLAGVAFAVILMFMEWGFQNALLDSTVALLKELRGELFLARRDHYSMSVIEPIERMQLVQAGAISGVKRVEPVYLEVSRSFWKHGLNGFDRPIRGIGIEPAGEIFRNQEIQQQLVRLKEVDTVLYDVRSKDDTFGPWSEQQRLAKYELSGRQVKVVGTFNLGTDFVNDGTVISSSDTFCRAFRAGIPSELALARVDFGLIEVEDGFKPIEVRDAINAQLEPRYVRAYTRDDFIELELAFWQKSTPIGIIFGIGMVVGFIVGVVICYQILYSDLSDHEAEFATLKAMGYPNLYFLQVVMQEALLLSLLGFIPGAIVSQLLYMQIARMTGLPMQLNLERVAVVLLLTATMCAMSGILAVRKVFASDPATLFK